MHAGLTNNLLYVDMLELGREWLLIFDEVDFLVVFGHLFREHSVADSLIWIKDCAVDQASVVFVGIFELYNFWFVQIQMCIFISIIFDLSTWWFQLPDVNSCGAHIIVYVLSKVFKIIIWILALLQVFPKQIVCSLFSVSDLLSLSFFSRCLFDVKGMFVLEFIHNLLRHHFRLRSFLHSAVFLKPCREELNWISWLLSACLSQSF